MPSSPTTPRAFSSADPVDRAVADRLSAGIRALPGVAGLHAGRYGDIALLYPRHRVNGLRRTPSALEVHLVVDLDHPRPLAEIAAMVRGVVKHSLDVPVDVHFDEATGGPS
ncbi:hypothetical protein [Corynebacterium comes]|uniref:Asp23/Gls24 family envelope stress response protein n=1 Tax=Corynebacterium comes TaxID=2675218 RepID=A0A6B8W272_9CORY|nr:hypothetical protein [Corynebacterium comes]QGU03730.1 hypothetical protein CETAM_02250 [Corynebacterium comes]